LGKDTVVTDLIIKDSAPSIVLNEIGKAFSGRTIFKGVTLQIPGRTITCVAGPSGIGKTTLLRIIAGFEKDHDGRVIIDDRDVTHEHPGTRGVAYLFQQPVLYPYLSVKENICFPMRLREMSENQIQDRVKFLSDRIQIRHLLSRKPDTLSGGERQRASLARAFASPMPVRLLDEPIKASLEPALRTELRSQLRKLHNELGGTTVLVTHDQDEGLEMADNVLVMIPDEKSIVLKKEEIYEAPPSINIALFIGGGTLIEANYNKATGNICRKNGQEYKLIGEMAEQFKNAANWIISA